MSEDRSMKNWHSMEIDEVINEVKGKKVGLSSGEVDKRLQEFGPNSLEAGKGISPLSILLHQVNNPLIYLLIGAALLSLFLGHSVDAIVIAGVIILNTLLGFSQEWKAEGALAALKKMASPHAMVLRDGEPREVEVENIVPGDILLLETGDRVAADARIIESEDLQIDESALTGESEPVSKSPKKIEEDTPMADQKNMLWMSTSVTAGRGKAVVIATGMNSEMGKIAGEIRSTGREITPLQKRMNKLGLILGISGVFFAGVVFLLGYLRGFDFVEILLYAVAVAVSAIPEGLPAVISVTLALGVRRMATRNAIIRRLVAVETLGSTTVICSDKTGTLTKNQMTVRKIWTGQKTFEVTGEGYQPEGRIVTPDGQEIDEIPNDLELLLRIGTLANNARLKKDNDHWIAEGNPSEAALLVASQKSGLDINKLRKETDRVHEVTFSSDRKYMATLHQSDNGKSRRAFVKGAPDRLVEFCTHVLVDGEVVELDDSKRDEINKINEEFASGALRVMAGAFKDFPGDKERLEPEEVEEGLTLAGLWGMIDPPREESKKAVSEAKEAGIHPVMITGDHAATAIAIAREVGISDSGKAYTGKDIDQMSNKELAKAALEVGVFARVSPSHKLKIMQALKEEGHIVAMTGDGVNDAPALKGADIGVAMGVTGTEVAKEASDMVLTDDNFATIVHAVEEGRVIFSNLRKVVFFLLTTNIGEILTLITALVIGFDLPLTAVMILWVNLVTDGACTIPIGMEPGHWEVLKAPPRDPKESIVHGRLWMRIFLLTPVMAAGTLGMFWYGQQSGSIDYARTLAFCTMVAFQWFQAFNARSERQSVFSIGLFSNRAVLFGIGVAVALQILVVQTPIGNVLFGTTRLGLLDWAIIVLVAATIWLADEVLKLLKVYGKPGYR
ncbi:MAG TPA: ATPase [Kosmotogaceae bacterium]|nr:MAG: Cation-transporting ATPase A, P type (ATPase, E1-E2 type) [Thermotogales bacterium 46_20]HAA85553.1 ATPase [Kosmotogaceae bacterium]